MPHRGCVHIIDDDPAMRESLELLISTEGLAHRAYASAREFLDGVDTAPPGCVVTDVRMPGMDGLELLAELTARGDEFQVIILTGQGDIAMAVDALKAGAADFLEKPFNPERLMAAVKAAMKARAARQAQSRWRQACARRLAGLTERERDVLRGVIDGASNREIAVSLGISPRTVESYRANLMLKTQAESLSELVRMVLAADPGEGGLRDAG